MRLSEIQDKDIIDITTGQKIGRIIDAIIDDNGCITSFIIQKTKLFNLLSVNNEVEIKWKQIKTIGNDVILTNLNN